MSPVLNRLLRDPFIQFLVLGGVVFSVFAFFGNEEGAGHDILVTANDVARLEALWQTQYSRAPTTEQRDAIVAQHVREEVLFREAMKLGLGQDDVIVRRRLVQKFLFLSEDMLEVAAPTEEELQQYFAANEERYLAASQTSFAHVYFSAERQQADAQTAAADAVERLLANPQSASAWRQMGDPFMLQREYAARDEAMIAQLFGPAFAESLGALPLGAWAGPVRSAYGWHAVRVIGRTQQKIPPLAEIKDQVIADYTAARRKEANEDFYKSVRDQYKVTVERAGGDPA